MITLSTASNALKTIYLGVIAEQLNTKINPFLSAVEKTSDNVFGKEVKKLITYGINGGISSALETGTLPKAVGNNYLAFTQELKNFFGKIEISDKAMRASLDNSGAFVNLLNAEMEGLLSASKRNFGRMLFGDGSGELCQVVELTNNSNNAMIKVNDVSKLDIGMLIDVEISGSISSLNKGKKIVNIDHSANLVYIDSAPANAYTAGSKFYMQGSKDNELTGLEAIFGTSDTLYGLSRANYSFLTPCHDSTGGAISASMIQSQIDNIEQISGGAVNYITTSFDVRRKYVEYCASNNHNVDILNLDCGYKALSYSGIPIVADRFCESQVMYLLNTDDFKLHQLCDWRWIEDAAGGILKPDATTASYSATLVKYADLMCERPKGQAKISNITIA